MPRTSREKLQFAAFLTVPSHLHLGVLRLEIL
jgi:hypothetical protein